MCDAADEYCDVWVERWRKARKNHRCQVCRETIRPGDRYHTVNWVFDGSAGQYKHCARCWMMVEAISVAVSEPFNLLLDCGEQWEDTIGHLPDEVAKLAFLTPDEAQELAG